MSVEMGWFSEDVLNYAVRSRCSTWKVHWLNFSCNHSCSYQTICIARQKSWSWADYHQV